MSERYESLGGVVNEVSSLLDGLYPPDLDPEAHRWRRCAKVNEEAGEVTEALLGCVNENPRKDAMTLDDVRKELLDTAFAALAAHAHLDGNLGEPVAALLRHGIATRDRLKAVLDAAS